MVNVFREYEDEIRVVGGWVPDLMFPEEGHVGSVDVDIMINHLTLQDEGLIRLVGRKVIEITDYERLQSEE